jgi:hypothetical protein
MTEADIEKLFIPDAELVSRYQARLGEVLNNPASSPQGIIELGELPAVYRELGIKDKELKMNNKTILKALGFDGPNKHNVPLPVMQNLLQLVYNPEGVFKSLSNSMNPDAFVSVLRAKVNTDPVIAILSPSSDGKGFTFIPTAYDRPNFEKFLERTRNEGKILYIKDKGTELWGQLQLLPRHNSVPYATNILTKSDVVKRIFERESQTEIQGARPLTRARRNIMAEQTVTEKTPEEKAFLIALHQRKVITEALKAGTLSCLPGADGYADTAPAVNIANGTHYHGANLLQLKEFQKQNGFPTAEFVTAEAAKQSGIPKKEDGLPGCDISFSSKNEATGTWEQKNVTLYNVAQSAEPEKLKEWAASQMEAKAQERTEYLKKTKGDNYKEYAPKEKKAGPDIECKSTDPEKYLGAYLAAVSSGAKFKATPEQAKEFSGKLENSIFEKMENGHSNPFKLGKICNAASIECKEVLKQVNQEKYQKREQGQGVSI